MTKAEQFRPEDIDIITTLTRASHRLSLDGAVEAATVAYRKLLDAPEKLDCLDHWNEASAAADAASERLIEAQHQVRLVATAAGDDERALSDATTVRDEARRTLVDALDAALELHEQRHGEKQSQHKDAEAASLLQRSAELTLTERLRLEKLQHMLLPTLNAWMGRIGGWREERDDLTRYVSGVPPSTEELKQLHAAFDAATKALKAAGRAVEDAEDDAELPKAQASVKAGRLAVQQAQARLRRERARLLKLSSSHFPELMRHDLLHLGFAESVAFRAVLENGRELEHYSTPDGESPLPSRIEHLHCLANKLSSRHCVYKCAPALPRTGTAEADLSHHLADCTQSAVARRARHCVALRPQRV